MLRQFQKRLLCPSTFTIATRSMSMFDQGIVMERLFANNKKWREGKKLLDPDYFDKTSKGQHPQYLWIGCSDSRVPAEEVTGLEPGEMFVHRNIANLAIANDLNCLSVVQYAVEHLRVKDIIICGHYGCGGVRAALENKHLGLLDIWLRNIRDVCRLHHEELSEIKDPQLHLDRAVELNTIEQCINIFKIGLVQRHQQKYGFPRIHGLVYNMQNGELKELEVDFQAYIRKYRSIYRLHTFESETPLRRCELQANTIRDLTKDNTDHNGRINKKFLFNALKNEPLLFSETEIKRAFKACSEFDVKDKDTIHVDSLIELLQDY